MDMELWDGIDCGVSEWVDAPWHGVLQRCLVKKKEMGVDKKMQKLAIDKEKEKIENDKMKEEFEKLVIDHKELKCIVRS
ncbi:hypothetical protein ZWY2020_017947 [Hordeum vulgare]|nr:hypothetical protein ZWY2020_017947 [Hordeum vulgare]